MSNLDGPLVSIVVATRNSGRTVAKCIESVRSQTYERKELVIIDGGSTDDTCEVLRQHARAISHWKSEPDHGVYDAWNKGLAACSGDWVCFLGSDDYLWEHTVLATYADILRNVPSSISVVYARVAILNKRGELLHIAGQPWQNARRKFRQLLTIPHPGTMHRRSLFNRIGMFDTNFQYAGDYELLLRELPDREAIFVPELIAVGMNWGGKTSSAQGMLQSLVESRRAQAKHGITPSVTWAFAFAIALGRALLFGLLGDRLASHIVDGIRVAAGKKPFWTRLT